MKKINLDNIVNFMSDNSFSRKILMGYCENLCDVDLNKISTDTGYEIFDYNGRFSVQFDSITKENEFHFDGISSPNLSRVPNFLLFEFIECASNNDQNPSFKLLDCELVLSDFSSQLKSSLVAKKLVINGHFNPVKPEFPANFSFHPIQVISGREVLRLHLPSSNPEYVEIREHYVYSINENIEIGIEGLSGQEAYNIFQEVHQVIEHSSALIKLKPEPGMIVVVNNNFCFHGREAPKYSSSRILRRTQFFKGLK